MMGWVGSDNNFAVGLVGWVMSKNFGLGLKNLRGLVRVAVSDRKQLQQGSHRPQTPPPVLPPEKLLHAPEK